jgi:6-phosphogluconolactonase
MKRISFFCLICGLLIGSLGIGHAAKDAPAKKYLLFIGTYTNGESKGIYAYRFDPGSGELSSLGLAAESDNPSFLAVSRNHRFLYAVNELTLYKGASTGAVTAFAIDAATSKLSVLNQIASHGADPCYISLDKTGKYVLVVNYTGGSVAVFPVSENGRLGEARALCTITARARIPIGKPVPRSLDRN